MSNSGENLSQDSSSGMERDETDTEKSRRETKVRIFKWQARTAMICLLARAVLLYHYFKDAVEAQQKASIGILSCFNLASWTFIIMECAFTLYRMLPQHLESIKFGPKARFRPRLRSKVDHFPTVDVLICYCGEEFDVLRDTVRAACSLDYPKDKFKVIVLDDSDSVSQQVNALLPEYPNLLYTARGSRNRDWHKAGNINHGLSFVAKLPKGPSELVAGLDVDMIANQDWLRRLTPHFILDSNIGIVSTNQQFYNVPHRDPLGQLIQYEQLQSVRCFRKDFGNVGLGAGSGWVARRAALDSIGGFATDGIAEDFLTCVDLQEAGWVVAILDETLQWGLVPDSYNGHAKQYRRWCASMLSYYKALSGTKKRPRRQHVLKTLSEISIISYMLAMTLCYIGLPLMVLSGQPLISFHNQQRFSLLLRLSFVDFVAQSLHGFLESWTADFMIFCWHEPSHLWHLPMFIPPVLHRWIPQLYKSHWLAKLTPANSVINRSTEDTYTSPWKRLRVLASEAHLATHLIVLCVCVAGMVRMALKLCQNGTGMHEILHYLIVRIGWPPALFFWTSALRNALKPFWYALFVQPRQRRESYLVRDEKTQVAHPTEEARNQAHRKVREWHLALILVYFICVVAFF